MLGVRVWVDAGGVNWGQNEKINQSEHQCLDLLFWFRC